MSDETGSPAGSESVTVVTLPADAPESFSSEREAARYLSESRRKNDAPPAESAPVATAEEPELAQANAAPPEEAPSEEPEAAEPQAVQLEPIEPPRSWTKAEKERFQSLPRETQEYLHTREQEREREVRRSQNEAADIRKAAEAAQKAAEEARQQYEAKAIASAQALLETQNNRFPDIKSMEDVERLARTARETAETDPFLSQKIVAYLADWNTHQQALQMRSHEAEEAKNRQAQIQQAEWSQHVQKENELAAEYIPELADKVKGPALTQRVASELLPELGFKDSELNDLAAGKSKLSIYDHRVQRLLADALKLRDIQSASKAVAAKPLPPVQRPGTVQPKASQAQKIQALEKQINNASGNAAIRLAAELNRLRRSA